MPIAARGGCRGLLAAVAAADRTTSRCSPTPRRPARRGTRVSSSPARRSASRVTADGHASYDVRIDGAGLPDPDSLGRYHGLCRLGRHAPTSTQWDRLGAVHNGTSTVGHGRAQQVPARHHRRGRTPRRRRTRGRRCCTARRRAGGCSRSSRIRCSAASRSESFGPRAAPMRCARDRAARAIAGSRQRRRTAMPGMRGDEATRQHAMAMPIPMPAGMLMMPGLVGLAAGRSAFLPGAGVDPIDAAGGEATTALTARRRRHARPHGRRCVRRTIHGHAFAMYGFNGQVPGPLIRVPQNATITVRFHNRIDLPSAVHWHGVRLDNRIRRRAGRDAGSRSRPAATSSTRCIFPTPGSTGITRTCARTSSRRMGLFGNMLVDSPEPDYYSPVNREQALVLSDLLINADTLIPFGKEAPDFALMGRVGNVLLVNGEPRYALRVEPGRGRALLSDQRRQLAHVQPLVRRRADQGRRVGREPVRARGAWCRAW